MGKDNFLTIGIPTYNRVSSLKRQLEFILEEISQLDFNVKILVSDNASTDNTAIYLDEISQRNNIEVVHQKVNLGLIGNYRFVINRSSSTYTWVVGDDDFIKPGRISKLIDLLYQKKPGLLHIGWGAAIIHDEQRSVDVFVENFYGYSEMKYDSDDTVSCMRIAQSVSGGFMFMTANILRTDLARRSFTDFHGKADNLGLPMWTALYSAHRGGFYFDKPTSLYCRHSNPRWSNEANKLFFCDVPHIVQGCIRLGWSKASVLKTHLLLISKKMFQSCKENPKYFFYIWGLLPFRLFFYKRSPLKKLEFTEKEFTYEQY